LFTKAASNAHAIMLNNIKTNKCGKQILANNVLVAMAARYTAADCHQSM